VYADAVFCGEFLLMVKSSDHHSALAPVRILIVQSNAALGAVWQRHMQRHGSKVTLCGDSDSAVQALEDFTFDAIVLDLVLERGNGLTVADVAAFRQPWANVPCVTDSSFFSDGSIFNHCATARLTLNRDVPPDELADIASHYGEQSAAAVR
jgi:CheY-like chemotaxis protein